MPDLQRAVEAAPHVCGSARDWLRPTGQRAAAHKGGRHVLWLGFHDLCEEIGSRQIAGVDRALSDIVAFLRGDDDARLADGWRAALLGDGIRDLVEGKAALPFEGGRLKLIAVS